MVLGRSIARRTFQRSRAVARLLTVLVGFELLSLLAAAAAAQPIAVISPDRSSQSISFAEQLKQSLPKPLEPIDADMAWAAFSSTLPATPYNMPEEEARLVGLRMGCDYFVLVRSEVVRRSSFERAEYYEAYSALYVVSRRTGRLVDWRLLSFEASKSEAARKLLQDAIPETAAKIAVLVPAVLKTELNQPQAPDLPEPTDNKDKDPSLRSPLPYRRLKPEYTAQASLYGVTATVEITVDLDAAGTITRTEITRWAGYGLDEAVDKAVRTMNWRPADRNGKPLAMRFTLQYNFKKLEKT